jgi:hypothetical protein
MSDSFSARFPQLTELSDEEILILRTRADSARRYAAAAAVRCVSKALQAGVRENGARLVLAASDEIWRELYTCVGEYTRVLRSLGEPPDRACELLADAVNDATPDVALHEAVHQAVRQWCAEAYRGD